MTLLTLELKTDQRTNLKRIKTDNETSFCLMYVLNY
mgnify:CR=1 FL=1